MLDVFCGGLRVRNEDPPVRAVDMDEPPRPYARELRQLYVAKRIHLSGKHPTTRLFDNTNNEGCEIIASVHIGSEVKRTQTHATGMHRLPPLRKAKLQCSAAESERE